MFVNRYEYIWIDGYGGYRSKTKIVRRKDPALVTLSEIPIWNYDGSSTNQATGSNSEVLLVPRALFRDPFRKNKSNSNMLVLCDTWLDDSLVKEPHPSNTRVKAEHIFDTYYK